MGTDDPGDRPTQPPRESQRRNGQPSSSGSIDSKAQCSKVDTKSTEEDGRPSLTKHHNQSSHVEPVDAFARLPANEATVGEVSTNSDQDVQSLDGVMMRALQIQDTQPMVESPNLRHNPVRPETRIGHGTNHYSAYNADARPPVRAGRRRARVPGVERIGRHRPELLRENSNDSFGGNSLFSDEQFTQQQDMLLVDAHLVEDQDSESNGPIAVAKPMDDTMGSTKRRMVISACVVVLVAAVAIGLSIGISTSEPNTGSSSNSLPNNETTIVATFVKMVPEFISPKSQAALSNPLSGQSQALLWMESLPIHNTMAIERLKQRFALAILYYSTGDQLWCNNDSWLTASDECTWFSRSIEPICSDGVYINLDLNNNCLQNVQLDDIFLLSSLRSLDLTGNTFSNGSFPEVLFRLTSLTALSLASVGIGGELPEGLKSLSNLELLDISNNQFGGNIQNVIALTGLKVFDCSTNNFGGPIPTEIGQLTNLVKWSSSSNSFKGVYATELGAFTELDPFHRRDAVVVSGIPSEVGNLSNLRSLDISFCHDISGKIPSEIGRLSKMESLILEYNDLSGTIPDEMFAMTKLETVALSNNRLSGMLSTRVDHMVSLRSLYAESNSLGGSLPTQIGNSTSLRRLTLSSNQFIGTIPSTLGNLDQLRSLRLSTNKFVGSIPTEIGLLAELSEIDLGYNSLTGTIPTEFGNLWNLTLAIFDNTTLVDPIPSELGSLLKSLTLLLYNTAMVGPMPAEICENVDSTPQVKCDVFVDCACCTGLVTSLGCEN